MDDKALKEYIKKELERGFKEEEIKRALLDVGYIEEDIERVFKKLSAKESLYSLIKKEIEDRSVKRYLIYVLISIICIVSSVYMLFLVDYLDLKSSFNLEENATIKTETNISGILENPFKDTPSRSTDISNKIVFPKTNSNTEKGEPTKFKTEMSQEKLDCMYENKIASAMCEAVVLDNIKMCNEIEPENEKNVCNDLILLKEALKNKEVCDKMNIVPQSLCLIVVDSDIMSCNKLDNDNLKKTCVDLIRLKEGIEENDDSSCSSMDTIDNSLCLGITKNNTSYCGLILSRVC